MLVGAPTSDMTLGMPLVDFFSRVDRCNRRGWRLSARTQISHIDQSVPAGPTAVREVRLRTDQS